MIAGAFPAPYAQIGPLSGSPTHMVAVWDQRMPEAAHFVRSVMPKWVDDDMVAELLSLQLIGPYFTFSVSVPGGRDCEAGGLRAQLGYGDNAHLIALAESLQCQPDVIFLTCLRPWTLDLVRVAFLRVAGFA